MISGPPARWIAPSTPPPPISEELAAFTMASVFSRVMSAGPVMTSNRPSRSSMRSGLGEVVKVGYQTAFHLMIVIPSTFLWREGSDLGSRRAGPSWAEAH